MTDRAHSWRRAAYFGALLLALTSAAGCKHTDSEVASELNQELLDYLRSTPLKTEKIPVTTPMGSELIVFEYGNSSKLVAAANLLSSLAQSDQASIEAQATATAADARFASSLDVLLTTLNIRLRGDRFTPYNDDRDFWLSDLRDLKGSLSDSPGTVQANTLNGVLAAFASGGAPTLPAGAPKQAAQLVSDRVKATCEHLFPATYLPTAADAPLLDQMVAIADTTFTVARASMSYEDLNRVNDLLNLFELKRLGIFLLHATAAVDHARYVAAFAKEIKAVQPALQRAIAHDTSPIAMSVYTFDSAKQTTLYEKFALQLNGGGYGPEIVPDQQLYYRALIPSDDTANVSLSSWAIDIAPPQSSAPDKASLCCSLHLWWAPKPPPAGTPVAANRSSMSWLLQRFYSYVEIFDNNSGDLAPILKYLQDANNLVGAKDFPVRVKTASWVAPTSKELGQYEADSSSGGQDRSSEPAADSPDVAPGDSGTSSDERSSSGQTKDAGKR